MSSVAPSPAPLTLARGEARDLDEVMAVMNSAFLPQFGEAWTRSQCAGILPMAGVSLILARHGEERACGFSLMRTTVDESELLLIAVDPSARRRGVGLALMNEFVRHAAQDGATRLHLEVRDGNEAGLLYRQAGFTLAGRRRNYYRGADGSQYDALTLVRDIGQV